MSGISAGTDELRNKVFGIGLARTGTTSLHDAMGVLGLRSAPNSMPLLDHIDRNFLASYDSFFDNPVPFRYRQLDDACPDSSWIVTTRPVEDWLASMKWLFGRGLDRLEPEMRRTGESVHRRVYGTDRFDEPLLRSIYERHYAELADWTTDRNAVWVDIDHELEWQPICDLLDLPIPDAPFPHSNRRRRRWNRRIRKTPTRNE